MNVLYARRKCRQGFSLSPSGGSTLKDYSNSLRLAHFTFVCILFFELMLIGTNCKIDGRQAHIE